MGTEFLTKIACVAPPPPLPFLETSLILFELGSLSLNKCPPFLMYTYATAQVNIYDESFFNHAGSPQERFHLRCNQVSCCNGETMVMVVVVVVMVMLTVVKMMVVVVFVILHP